VKDKIKDITRGSETIKGNITKLVARLDEMGAAIAAAKPPAPPPEETKEKK